MLKEQELIFDKKPQKLFTLQDVTKLHENQQLITQNRIMQLLSSSCNHELLTPIRSVIHIASSLLSFDSESNALRTIVETCHFLLNQVQANMDLGLLS